MRIQRMWRLTTKKDFLPCAENVSHFRPQADVLYLTLRYIFRYHDFSLNYLFLRDFYTPLIFIAENVSHIEIRNAWSSTHSHAASNNYASLKVAAVPGPQPESVALRFAICAYSIADHTTSEGVGRSYWSKKSSTIELKYWMIWRYTLGIHAFN